MAQLTYGNNEAYTVEAPVDVSTVWGQNVLKMARAKYSQILGQDCAQAVPKVDGEDVESKRHEWRVNRIKALQAAPLGTRSGGPRKDPLAAEMQDQALRLLKAAVQGMKTADGKKVTLPTRMDGTFTFDDGTVLTLREIIARKIVKEHDEIRRAAQEAIRVRERGARRVVPATVNTVEALGI